MSVNQSRSMSHRSLRLVLLLLLLCACVTYRQWISTDARESITSKEKQRYSSCPCIDDYLRRIDELGIVNGNLTFAEWERALCPSEPPKEISDRPLILGVGPGTTATRSFALAVSLMQHTILHYGVIRKANGSTHWEWNKNKDNNKHNDSLPVLEFFQTQKLLDGMQDYQSWKKASDIDFATLFDTVDGVFDYPFPFYAVDILKTFPHAKVLMTHRDPEEWYQKRLEFCSGPQKTTICSVPYLLRPLNITMLYGNMTRHQAVESFRATEDAVRCMVAPERYLQVDAWNPPPEGWMPTLAKFLDLPVPSEESKCIVPLDADHNLHCMPQDPSCRACNDFFRHIG